MSIPIVILVLFAGGDAPFSVRESFADRFEGWYSFDTQDGQSVELIAVIDDGLASIGTGSRATAIIQVRHAFGVMNVAYTNRSELVLLVALRWGKARIFLPGLSELAAGKCLWGKYSRKLKS
jgi:hypothetical protein